MTEPVSITGDLLIGKQSTGDNKTFHATNPATNSSLAPAFAIAGEIEANAPPSSPLTRSIHIGPRHWKPALHFSKRSPQTFWTWATC